MNNIIIMTCKKKHITKNKNKQNGGNHILFSHHILLYNLAALVSQYIPPTVLLLRRDVL